MQALAEEAKQRLRSRLIAEQQAAGEMSHHIAPEAERDLDDIAYYIARETGSIDIAERLIISIASRFTFWPAIQG